VSTLLPSFVGYACLLSTEPWLGATLLPSFVATCVRLELFDGLVSCLHRTRRARALHNCKGLHVCNCRPVAVVLWMHVLAGTAVPWSRLECVQGDSCAPSPYPRGGRLQGVYRGPSIHVSPHTMPVASWCACNLVFLRPSSTTGAPVQVLCVPVFDRPCSYKGFFTVNGAKVDVLCDLELPTSGDGVVKGHGTFAQGGCLVLCFTRQLWFPPPVAKLAETPPASRVPLPAPPPPTCPHFLTPSFPCALLQAPSSLRGIALRASSVQA
jgi:hypothetical protein